MTVVSPSVSIASRRRTIAPRRAIARAPSASAAVTVAARPFGHGGDRDGDADEERLVQGLAAREHRPGEQNGDDDADDHHLPRQARQPARERRGRRLGGRGERLDLPELGRRRRWRRRATRHAPRVTAAPA